MVLIELRAYLQPCIDFAFTHVFSDDGTSQIGTGDLQMSLGYFDSATALIRRWSTSMDDTLIDEDLIPKIKKRMDFIYEAYDISLKADENMRYPNDEFVSLGTAVVARRAVAESPCAQYVWSKLVGIARLFQQASVQELEVLDLPPTIANVGLRKSNRQAENPRQHICVNRLAWVCVCT